MNDFNPIFRLVLCKTLMILFDPLFISMVTILLNNHTFGKNIVNNYINNVKTPVGFKLCRVYLDN